MYEQYIIFHTMLHPFMFVFLKRSESAKSLRSILYTLPMGVWSIKSHVNISPFGASVSVWLAQHEFAEMAAAHCLSVILLFLYQLFIYGIKRKSWNAYCLFSIIEFKTKSMYSFSSGQAILFCSRQARKLIYWIWFSWAFYCGQF